MRICTDIQWIRGCLEAQVLYWKNIRYLENCFPLHFCLFLFLLPDHSHQAAVTESAGLTHRTEIPLFKGVLKAAQAILGRCSSSYRE